MSKVEKIIAENLNLTTEDIAEGLLETSGIKGKIPTNWKQILTFLDLKQLSFSFMNELEFVSAVTEKNVRAILSFNEKVIAVHGGLNKKQTIFSTFHEVGHFTLPEHIDKLYLCDINDLSFFAKSRLEAEANRLAADLIFQVDHFTEEANTYPLECSTITKLVEKYDASFEATARRYVEKHYLPCALIVYKKIVEGFEELELDGLPIFKVQYTITSNSFREKYFTNILKEEVAPGKSLVYDAYKKFDATQIVKGKIQIEIVGKGKMMFDSELFTNIYKVFRLVSPVT
jgi:hypothetical protein